MCLVLFTVTDRCGNHNPHQRKSRLSDRFSCPCIAVDANGTCIYRVIPNAISNPYSVIPPVCVSSLVDIVNSFSGGTPFLFLSPSSPFPPLFFALRLISFDPPYPSLYLSPLVHIVAYSGRCKLTQQGLGQSSDAPVNNAFFTILTA